MELSLNWDLNTAKCIFFEVAGQFLTDLKLLMIVSNQKVARSLVPSFGSWERFYFKLHAFLLSDFFFALSFFLIVFHENILNMGTNYTLWVDNL